MSPLPRPGELREASDALNERLAAVFGGAPEDEAAGYHAEMSQLRAAFGDLFDIDEMQEVALAFVGGLLQHLLEGEPMIKTYVTAFAQGAALGAMTERRRWEARP